MNFLSELLLIQDITAGTAFDKSNIAGAITGKSDLCIVVKKANVNDSITAVKVEHSDTSDGEFTELDNNIVKETLPVNTGKLYETIGLKNDQLKNFVKVTVTATNEPAGLQIIASKI